MRWWLPLPLAGCFTTPARPEGPTACQQYGDWGDKVALTSLNSPENEFTPSLSADGLRIVFTSFRSSPTDAYEAVRPSLDSAFGAPVALGLLGFRSNPVLSHDGLQIWFEGTIDATSDILVAQRASLEDTFSLPTRFEPFAAPARDEGDLAFSADLLDAVLNIGPTNDTSDIYLAHRPRPEEPFTTMALAPGLVNPGYDCCATLSHDGTTIVYESRQPVSTDVRIVEATRPDRDSPFGAIGLFAPLNDSYVNSDPELSVDGTRLVYSSLRDTNTELFEIARTCQDP